MRLSRPDAVAPFARNLMKHLGNLLEGHQIHVAVPRRGWKPVEPMPCGTPMSTIVRATVVVGIPSTDGDVDTGEIGGLVEDEAMGLRPVRRPDHLDVFVVSEQAHGDTPPSYEMRQRADRGEHCDQATCVCQVSGTAPKA